MGRNNKRVDADIEFDVAEPKKKGTSYQRKQRDIEVAIKKNSRAKRSKKLDAYSDSNRAKTNEAIRNYMNGKYSDDYDDYDDF